MYRYNDPIKSQFCESFLPQNVSWAFNWTLYLCCKDTAEWNLKTNFKEQQKQYTLPKDGVKSYNNTT
jgi:hypothetical protein